LIRILALLGAALTSLGLCAHPGTDAAIADFDRQIAENPSAQHLFLQRGALLSADGHWEQARHDFERAMMLGDPVVVACEMGFLSAREGRLQESLRYLSAYLDRYPADQRCRAERARIADLLGQSLVASADYRVLLDYDPIPNPGVWMSAIQHAISADPANSDEVWRLVDLALARLGPTPSLVEMVVTVAKTLGDLDRAIDRLEAFPLADSPEWYAQMALLYQCGGDRDMAAKHRASALALLSSLKPAPARIELGERLASVPDCASM